eukprot:TRINITY_DN59005_c0_g1_i1.p1 TRINITY_DN59005_c0_g1~~TRINITY_DN59005_c0_g1_i1.p1  ORF type:complete len:519 (+),score=60.11 TRINITY_DN59005_c0_g1_i1:114-1670(+)
MAFQIQPRIAGAHAVADESAGESHAPVHVPSDGEGIVRPFIVGEAHANASKPAGDGEGIVRPLMVGGAHANASKPAGDRERCVPAMRVGGAHATADRSADELLEFSFDHVCDGAHEHLRELKIVPVVAMAFCPPGGLYLDLLLLIYTYASYVGQIVTFVRHNDLATALLMSSFMLMACYYTYLTFFKEGLLIGLLSLRKRVQKSVCTGIEDSEVAFLFYYQSSIAGGLGGLVAPYRILCIADLGWLSAANAAISLLLKVKGLGTEMMKTHLGDIQQQFGSAAVKNWPQGGMQCFALQVWAISTVGAQLTLSAIVACVWHPAIAALLLFPAAITFALANSWRGNQFTCLHWFMFSCFEPLHLMAPLQSSVFGLQQWDPKVKENLGNLPGWYHCLAQAVRLAAIAGLMYIDCPRMYLGSWQLQPMGRSVLISEFFEPVFGLMRGKSIGAAAAAFQIFVIGLASVTLPIYLCGLAFLLATNTHFRSGRPDDSTNESMCTIEEQAKSYVASKLYSRVRDVEA